MSLFQYWYSKIVQDALQVDAQQTSDYIVQYLLLFIFW